MANRKHDFFLFNREAWPTWIGLILMVILAWLVTGGGGEAARLLSDPFVQGLNLEPVGEQLDPARLIAEGAIERCRLSLSGSGLRRVTASVAILGPLDTMYGESRRLYEAARANQVAGGDSRDTLIAYLSSALLATRCEMEAEQQQAKLAKSPGAVPPQKGSTKPVVAAPSPTPTRPAVAKAVATPTPTRPAVAKAVASPTPFQLPVWGTSTSSTPLPTPTRPGGSVDNTPTPVSVPTPDEREQRIAAVMADLQAVLPERGVQLNEDDLRVLADFVVSQGVYTDQKTVRDSLGAMDQALTLAKGLALIARERASVDELGQELQATLASKGLNLSFAGARTIASYLHQQGYKPPKGQIQGVLDQLWNVLNHLGR